MKKKTKVIKVLVLVNHRNREISVRSTASRNVFCFKIRCTLEQFVNGDLHEKSIDLAKKFTHSRLNASSEDFDFVCFDKFDGHFISSKVWKYKMWKESETLDISNDPISKQEDI